MTYNLCIIGEIIGIFKQKPFETEFVNSSYLQYWIIHTDPNNNWDWVHEYNILFKNPNRIQLRLSLEIQVRRLQCSEPQADPCSK